MSTGGYGRFRGEWVNISYQCLALTHFFLFIFIGNVYKAERITLALGLPLPSAGMRGKENMLTIFFSKHYFIFGIPVGRVPLQ